MEIDIMSIIFEFFGGLGIFLLGIKSMGDGLQKSAGDRLKDILDKFTSNPILGVIAGMIVTVLIQSSSGTTVLTVGLVNAGFMTLKQSIGVIMGANIGTTITAFIIGIKLENYALPILAVGALIIFFVKNKKIVNIGEAIFGFGALFFGLKLMGDGLAPLREVQAFHELMVDMSENSILGFLVGMIFTFVVQSSSATIGILQNLFGQGAIELEGALPVLFGNNVGTTITAVLASIGAAVAARRAALTHVVFNLVGSVIIMILLGPYTNLIAMIRDALGLNAEMTIAFAHGIFNIANTLLLLPFIGVLAFIVTKLVPGEDSSLGIEPTHLDPIFIQQSPSVALDQAKEEVVRMGMYAVRGLEEAALFASTHESIHADNALQLENTINRMDQEITDYLIDLAATQLSDSDSEKHSALLDCVRDIERMGDHFENIIELIQFKISNKTILTDQAKEDLEEMFEITIKSTKEAVESLLDRNRQMALKVVEYETQIDQMEKTFRKKHIIRLNEGICAPNSGMIYVDIISNLERIGDHALNIAEEVIGEKIPEAIH
ncbi:Na/Pi cotransporter family protein [Amphibacillus xylanus]|uniref:Putative transporter n=1 Tax=Amphibacillus xylanus (strain ATCC 51415 / DSM 6626 / JCM 7361 / LMG 17667 / NBRC 15112 / Ep01) TaxID=698758 RepID=K0IXX3_AMPXN|nr:Na/Pi cotransporter family protein [Amphibacillus xylanus]BAM47264.1 putative transporter [Amphibacillus xylanus NBRC 15112]